jgi:protein-S-isoprenylcysteine O-methyltransferase Ste14
MKKNIGTPDKIVRLSIAVLLLTLSVTHNVTAKWSTILIWSLSTILILAALDGTCPLYALLGINTKPKD